MAHQGESGDWPDGNRRFTLGKSWKAVRERQNATWNRPIKLETESLQKWQLERPTPKNLERTASLTRLFCHPSTHGELCQLCHLLRVHNEVRMMQIWSKGNINRNGSGCHPCLLELNHYCPIHYSEVIFIQKTQPLPGDNNSYLINCTANTNEVPISLACQYFSKQFTLMQNRLFSFVFKLFLSKHSRDNIYIERWL